MKTHNLKTEPKFFKPVFEDGLKDFEIRKNDRDFKKFDLVLLKEYDPDEKEYTGRWSLVRIDYILHDKQFLHIKPGYCIFSFTVLTDSDRVKEQKYPEYNINSPLFIQR